MIPREILKKIRLPKPHTGFFAVCGFAWFLCTTTATLFGAVLPPQIPVNEGAGCGGCIVVNLRLGLGETVNMLVDTGAPITVLDSSFAPKLGKRLHDGKISFECWRKQQAGWYAAPKFFLGDVQLKTADFIPCTDVAHAGWILKHFCHQKIHVDGILGMDCLQHYRLQFDFAAGTISFLDPATTNTADWGKMYPLTMIKPVPGESLCQPLLDHADFFGHRRSLIVDTGCYDDATENCGRFWWLKYSLFLGHERIHSLVWDGNTYSKMRIMPTNTDALGLKFLARHLVTLDFPNQRMYLKQTSIAPLKPIKNNCAS